MLRIGRFRMFGDGARRHFPREVGIACRITDGKPRRRARTKLVDRGADHKIGQRHLFGEADNPWTSGSPWLSHTLWRSGKNTLVRNW